MFDPNDECALLSRRTMLAGGISLGIAGSLASSAGAAMTIAEPAFAREGPADGYR